MNNVVAEIEAQALAIAADPKRLKQQLLETKTVLQGKYRDRSFQPCLLSQIRQGL